MCPFNDSEGSGVDSHLILFSLADSSESGCPSKPFLLNSSKGIPICADNTEVEEKEELAAEPLMVADQKVVKNEVEQKIEKSELAPTFDFRGKQKTVIPIKEKPKAVEVKATEADSLVKPKFDFRNRKS